MTIEIVAYEPDLLFSSKIASVAETAGAKVTVIGDYETLLRELRNRLPRVLILSLDALEGRLSALEQFTARKSCIVFGYYSHVNVKLAEEAKRAGIGRVLSRGAFAARIKELFADAISGA